MTARRRKLADQLLAMVEAQMVENVRSSRWFQTAPTVFKERPIEIELTGIEYHPVYTSMGGIPTGSFDAPFVCGSTSVGGIAASFRLRLEFDRVNGFTLDGQ